MQAGAAPRRIQADVHDFRRAMNRPPAMRPPRPGLAALRRLAARAWAAPNSALGLALACVVVAAGGWWRLRAGAIECGGGRLGRAAARLPPAFAFRAITLGHVILGVDGPALDAARRHEQVHVRQYERWGPLFLPAYLLSSAWQWLRGRRPYLDNHFEREAYARAGAAQRHHEPAGPRHRA